MFGIEIGEEEKQKAWQAFAAPKPPTHEKKANGIAKIKWRKDGKISNLVAENVGWCRSSTQCSTPPEKREAGS